MGNGPTTTYFQELEKEAKLARRLDGIDECGLMVKAVRLGIPESYSKSIAFMGFNIPGNYPKWKAHILTMYKERQKKWVFDQTFGGTRESQPPLKGQSNTATSHHKTGGATSSSLAKPTSNALPREPGTGWWQPVKTTTYHGAGEPMDISQL
ncbi:hypothetical protein ARMSODRAFT_1019944 [Armillaria solidipes]|uniref:Uncharacterized protein n=1 Tax=Armillaria solidipes TaxID=1076256 RepID=A0A2H3BC12_9AGAR|nr:hypothetical protein ARMSODRAFT_1019944 [Armillaria solidipes]